MKKFIQLLTILLIIIPNIAMADTDTIIQGVTEFLIERAKENNFYIFEKRLQDNNDFKTYFPHTYSFIANGDLKILLTSKNIWEKAVQDDLDKLVTRTFARSINKSIDLSKEANKGMDRYLDLVQYLSIDIDGQLYPLNMLPINANQNVRNIINGFWGEPNSLRDELIKLSKILKDYENVENVNETSSDDLLKHAQTLMDAFQNLDKFVNHIEIYKKQLRINSAAIKARCSNDPALIFCRTPDVPAADQLQKSLGEIKTPLQDVLIKASKLIKFLKEIPQARTKTEQVIISMRFLTDIGFGSMVNVEKLKRQVLFFSRLSEISNTDEVKAILAEYTLPAVSFYIKRQTGTNHILLSSYLGFAYGKTFATTNDGNNTDQGIIAPIGLELSRGLASGDSIGLMLAPIDFGYPVTLKINGIKEKLSFSDIFAPGAYLAYGIRSIPVNVGLAYQRGRQIDTSKDVENKVLLFVSYDMPLLTLY